MKRSELKQLISECVREVLQEHHEYYDHEEDFLKRHDEILLDIVGNFLKGAKHVYWPVIKAEPLARIWLEYGKRGTIHNEEGLDKIADQMIDLVARLVVTTELCGHTQRDIRAELEDDYDYTFTDDEWGRLLGSLEDKKSGQEYLSDYGLKPLEILALKLYGADTPEQKLHIIDRMLNVVHQRSDLASMFIQGGTNTLNKIADQGGYATPFEDFGDRARQQRQYQFS